MGNIVIGYKNLTVDSDPTITASTEHADYDADNLKIAHPSEFHRLTSLSGMWQKFDFGTYGERYNLVVPLYVTATAQRNLIPASFYPTGTDWTVPGNADMGGPIVATTDVPPVNVQPFGIYELVSASGTYQIEYTTTFVGAAIRSSVVHARIYAYQSTGTRNSAIRIGDATDYVEVQLTSNGQQPAYYASSTGGTATLDAYSVTDAGSNWSLVTLTMTYPVSKSNIVFRLATLDSSYAATYTGANYESRWAGPQMYFANHGEVAPKQDFFNTTTAQDGPHYDVRTDDTADMSSTRYDGPLRHLSENPSLCAERGWSHGAPTIIEESQMSGTPDDNRRYCQVRYADPDNADSRLDVSNVYIGPYWQPTVNLAHDWRIRPAAGSPSVGTAYGGQEYRSQTSEPRELTFRLGYESPEDALGEAHTMGVKVGQHSPVLVIIDPDETDYPQTMTFYGTVKGLDIGALGWFADRGDGTAGHRYEIKMTIRELLP